jgi:Holliday junction resolvasome RuvABC endonuclease subunit
MNILSIDPSKRSFGIYIYTPDKCYSMVIKAKASDTEGQVLTRIYSEITQIVERYKIDLVLMEDYAFSQFKTSRSPTTLAEIAGVVKLACAQCKGFIKVSISTWKSFFRWLPKNKNKAYIEKVNQIFKRKFETADECDAFLILTSVFNIWKGYCNTPSQIQLHNELKKLGEVFPI